MKQLSCLGYSMTAFSGTYASNRNSKSRSETENRIKITFNVSRSHVFWLKLSLFFGRCCCCDLRVIQLNLYRASNRFLGLAPSDVTLWTFASLSPPAEISSLKSSTRPFINRDDKRRTCRMPLSSPPDRLIRLVGIDHRAVEKENKENRRRAEKLLLIDLFSCTFAWFKFLPPAVALMASRENYSCTANSSD